MEQFDAVLVLPHTHVENQLDDEGGGAAASLSRKWRVLVPNISEYQSRLCPATTGCGAKGEPIDSWLVVSM